MISIVLILSMGRLSAQTNAGQAVKDTAGNKLKSAETVPGRLLNLTKANSTSANASAGGDDLYSTPTPAIANTMYGRISGLTVSQSSGEPGFDYAGLGIRGVGTFGYTNGSGFNTFKIYVDGFQVNPDYFNYLSATEIESVSILKDAAALATFGMNGANGVIWVVTKRGKPNKATITFQARTGLQTPVNLNKPLGAYDYANLYNQAISNDNGDVWTPKYSPTQLQAYQNGTGTNVDWMGQDLSKYGLFGDGDVVFSGGDNTAQYNIAFNYANQQGLYNVPSSGTTSNEAFDRYNLRANLDFKMSDIFSAKVDIGGRLEDRRAPNYTSNYSTAKLWNDLYNYPANIYPIFDGTTTNFSGTNIYPNNPYASINGLGWESNRVRILQGNFSLKEKLDFIAKGLYLNEATSFESYDLSTANEVGNYARYINGATTTPDKPVVITTTNLGAAAQEDWKQVSITAGYDQSFGKNQITSAVNFYSSNYKGEGQFAYQIHYENVSGRVNYSFDQRYVAEFGFSYFGSDAYAPGNQWGFYPTISAAWNISNESFLKSNAIISNFKLRASVGETGSSDSQFSPASNFVSNGRYLYQQYYQSTGSFYTGNSTPTGSSILAPLFQANPKIFAEKSMKYNIGTDITLFKKLSIGLDVFLDKRSNIITIDNTIPSSFGNNVYLNNIGKMTNKGVDATSSYTNRIGKVGYSINGMISFNKNTIDYESEATTAYPYNAQTGRSYGTIIGLEANGFYETTDFNPNGTLKAGVPQSLLGKVQPGDIKYVDLNGDGKIDQKDVTAIGNPPFPEVNYSFGGSLNYNSFDLSILFQGVGGTSVNLLGTPGLVDQSEAFVNNGNAFAIAQGAWAYYPAQGIDTRATATYPRLTTVTNSNNYAVSSFWIKSGDYLRIRNAEIGYNFNERIMRVLHLSKLRLYVNAVNPVTWSSLLKNYNIDPEVTSGYPILKSYNVGFSATF